MENETHGGPGVRTPVGIGPARVSPCGVSPDDGSVPLERGAHESGHGRHLLGSVFAGIGRFLADTVYAVFGRGLLGCGVLALLGLLSGPVGATQHTATTYTGSPFNFCLPGYDSFDYQDCWDFNFTVANSSWGALSTSTSALAARVAVLEVFESTAGPRVAAHDVFMSTAGPAIDVLKVYQGTASVVTDSLQVWKGTASVVIDSLQVWKGTASVTLADYLVWKGTMTTNNLKIDTSTNALSVSTNSLLTTKLSSPTASGTAGQFLRIKTDGTNEWATVSAGSGETNTWGGDGSSKTFITTVLAKSSAGVTVTYGVVAGSVTSASGLNGQFKSNDIGVSVGRSNAPSATSLLNIDSFSDHTYAARFGNTFFNNQGQIHSSGGAFRFGNAAGDQAYFMSNSAKTADPTMGFYAQSAAGVGTAYSFYDPSGTFPLMSISTSGSMTNVGSMTVVGLSEFRNPSRIFESGTLYTGATTYSLEVFSDYNSGTFFEPSLGFRMLDTTVSPGDYFGSIFWRDHDASTGGSKSRAQMSVRAAAGSSWGDGQNMDSDIVFGIRRGANMVVEMTINSTDTLVNGLRVYEQQTLQPGASFYTAYSTSATGWSGTSGGTITVTGNYPMSNVLDTPVISTSISCASAGVASMTFVVTLDNPSLWDLSLWLYQVSAATGVIGIIFDDQQAGTQYNRNINNAGANGPYTLDASNFATFVSSTSTRWFLEQNQGLQLDVTIGQDIPSGSDHVKVNYRGVWEQSGAGGTALEDAIYGKIDYNPAGTKANIQKFTIFEPLATTGQGLFCGQIKLSRRGF